ncbi:hypothetical protein [Acidianus manzaensis]|uniref:Novel STAND NTPase 3 domain-containing protein n=1 Tax=Acidianus manzaensis TaxID=282676 RepID=A0A1W6K3D5_9CREN|nr:hypothetical protein [Acidianus manzaensis]ARM76954.1 hypothetical protein B6F84_13635 [Acidianus manzaensis]
MPQNFEEKFLEPFIRETEKTEKYICDILREKGNQVKIIIVGPPLSGKKYFINHLKTYPCEGLDIDPSKIVEKVLSYEEEKVPVDDQNKIKEFFKKFQEKLKNLFTTSVPLNDLERELVGDDKRSKERIRLLLEKKEVLFGDKISKAIVKSLKEIMKENEDAYIIPFWIPNKILSEDKDSQDIGKLNDILKEENTRINWFGINYVMPSLLNYIKEGKEDELRHQLKTLNELMEKTKIKDLIIGGIIDGGTEIITNNLNEILNKIIKPEVLNFISSTFGSIGGTLLSVLIGGAIRSNDENPLNGFLKLVIKWKTLNDDLRKFFAYSLAFYLGVSFNEVCQALEALNNEEKYKKLEQLIEETHPGIKQITGKDLPLFYNIQGEVVNIHEDEFNKVWELVKEELSNPTGKIIVIRGEMGVGKTYLAYRIARDIAEKYKDIKIYWIKGPGNFTDYMPVNRAVYLWDDSNFEENSWEIFKVGRNSKNKPNGPVIISLSNFRFNKMMEKLKDSYKENNEELKSIEQRIMEIETKQASEKELAEVFYSQLKLLEEQERNNSPQIETVQKFKDDIIRESKGLPIFIRFFFDKIRKGSISEEEIKKFLENMHNIHSLEEYVKNRVKDAYLSLYKNNGRLHEVKKEKLCLLSFLKLACMEGVNLNAFYPLVDEDEVEDQELKLLINALTKLQWRYIDEEEVRLPLFEVNYEGEVVPIHPSVLIGIEENLKEVLKAENIDTNYLENIEEKIREYIKKNKDKYLKVIESIEDPQNLVDLELNGLYPPYTLSLFWLLEEEEREKYEVWLLKYLMVIFEKSNRTILIDALGYVIFQIIYILQKDFLEVENIKHVIKYIYLKLIESNNETARLLAWLMLPELLDKRIINKEEAIQRKNYYLKLLESNNEIIRDDAWSKLSELLDKRIINKEDSNYFLKLLESNDEIARLLALLMLPLLPLIIVKEEAVKRKIYYLELLFSDISFISDGAKLILPELKARGIISDDEIKKTNNK